MIPTDQSSEMPAAPDRGFSSWILWVGFVVLLVACHIKFLFLQGHAETGDFAANALQIREAKSFHELYGNYSRWGFHHPGPAFFYAYALGEWLWHDLSGLVPAPFNAHILVGIMIQAGFFVWALSIIGKRVSHPLIIPLLLVLAAIHFTVVTHFIHDSVFVNIWPPYVLLFPFLCLVVACASLAAGAAEDMVAATVAGSFLAHGHVAQPLFVVPCFLLAMIAFLRSQAVAEGSLGAVLKRHAAPIAVSVAVVTVALTPIVIDAVFWERSNLRAICQHFTGHASDRKTLGASLVYLASFYCYIGDPEKFCDQLTADSLRFLRDRWFFIAVWAAIFFFVTAFSRQLLRKNSFFRWLCFYFGLATVLTICWGILQNGTMVSFNSHFNYGLIFILLVLFGVIICQWLPQRPGRLVSITFTMLGLLLFVPVTRGWRLDLDMPALAFLPKLSDGLATAARADGRPTKFLQFPHPEWPRAISVALALRRLNYDYVVSPDWAFMFGRAHARSMEQAATSDDVAVWSFGQTSAAGPGFALKDGSFVVTARPLLDPTRGEIRFAGGDANAPQYVLTGWKTAGPEAGRLGGSVGVIEFRPIRTAQDVELTVGLTGPNSPASSADRQLTIRFDGQELVQAPASVDGKVSVRVPRELWNRDGVARLVFQVNPVSQSANGAAALSAPAISFDKIIFNGHE